MAKQENVATTSGASATTANAAPAMSLANSSFLSALYREHTDSLRRYIFSRFGPGPPEPEEVAQAAFAKFAGAGDIVKLGDPRKYLYSIACNIVIDHHRRARHRDAVHGAMQLQSNADILSEITPERVLLAKEQFAVLETALKAMPPMRRRIFLMVRVEGLSPAVLARRFALSEGAVHKHVSRAFADCVAAFNKAEKTGGGGL